MDDLITHIWNTEAATLSIRGYRIYVVNDKFMVLADVNNGDISYIGTALGLGLAVEMVVDHITGA